MDTLLAIISSGEVPVEAAATWSGVRTLLLDSSLVLAADCGESRPARLSDSPSAASTSAPWTPRLSAPPSPEHAFSAPRGGISQEPRPERPRQSFRHLAQASAPTPPSTQLPLAGSTSPAMRLLRGSATPAVRAVIEPRMPQQATYSAGPLVWTMPAKPAFFPTHRGS